MFPFLLNGGSQTGADPRPGHAVDRGSCQYGRTAGLQIDSPWKKASAGAARLRRPAATEGLT
jgi:hypothetical protein